MNPRLLETVQPISFLSSLAKHVNGYNISYNKIVTFILKIATFEFVTGCSQKQVKKAYKQQFLYILISQLKSKPVSTKHARVE